MFSNSNVAAASWLGKNMPMARTAKHAGAGLGLRIHRAIMSPQSPFRNLSDVARALHITRSSVSQWLNNETEPTPERLRKLAVITKVNHEWLSTNRGPMFDADLRSEDVAAGELGDDVRRLDVVGYVGANGRLTRLYGVNQGHLDKIEADDDDPKTAVAAQIMGTSLGPMFDRWYVVYSDVRRPMTDDLIGDLCVVGLPDESVILKWVKRGKKPGRFDLLSNDPAEPPINDAEIAWAARATLRSRKQR